MNVDLDKVNRNSKRIMFMGTPEFAVPVLEGLIKSHDVKVIVTQPSRAKKDGKIVDPPVRKVGEANTILVIQPQKIKEEIEDILSFNPDLIITCAYGQLLPKEILEAPKYGCINVHASLLPKLRGGAPIHRAILKGHTKTGITIMHMSKALDSGDIIVSREIPIDNKDTASSLHDKLSILGRDLLLEVLPSIFDGTAPRTPQDHDEATFAFNLRPEDEKIDFHKSSKQIYDRIRGLAMWPGAYCLFNNKRLKVYESYISGNFFESAIPGEITAIYEDGFGVKAENREVVFTKVKPEGKKLMSAVDFINGLQEKEKIVGKLLR